MPNFDFARGLRPLARTEEGGEPVVRWFKKAAAIAGAIFENDAVAKGDVGLDTAITPGTTLYSGVSLTYGAASTLTNHPVIVSPSALYEAQANGTVTETMEGQNANLVLGAGDVATRRSGHQVNIATIATTATLDVHVIEKHKEIDNQYTTGAGTRLVIRFNKHRAAEGVAGV